MSRVSRLLVPVCLVFLVACAAPQSIVYSQTKRYIEILDGSIHKSFRIVKNGLVSVENFNGNILIESWDKNEVDVEITEVKRGDNEIEIEFIVSSDRIEIQALYPDDRGWRWRPKKHSKAHFELKVPRHIDIYSGTTNGNVAVSDITGSVEAETTNGKVAIRGITGDLDARSTNGKVSIRDVTGDLQARTTNGSIDITGVEGEITAKTTNSSITIQDAKCPEIEAGTTNGSIRADFVLIETGYYDFNTTNGSVKIYIPEDSKVDIDVKCRERNFTSDFDILSQYKRRERGWSASRIKGTINGGGASLTMKTTHGRVSLLSK